jgi:hypothetical protein
LNFISFLKRFFIFLTLLIIILLAGGIAFTYFYKDKLISLFVAEINNHINTEVKVEKIDLSLFENFPEISIQLNNVKISEPKDKKKQFLSAKNIFLSFDIALLLKEIYEIKKIRIDDADANLIRYADGSNNFDIIKKSADKNDRTINFNLQSIEINNSDIRFANIANAQFYHVYLKNATNSLAQVGHKYLLKSKGNIISKIIEIEKNKYFKDKELSLNTELLILLEDGIYEIKPSEIKIGDAYYAIKGRVNTIPLNELDLKIEGKNTTLQNIFSLLPEKFSEPFKTYKSEGNVYFKGDIKGEVSSKINPEIRFDFGANNASLFHPEYNKKITNISLKGYYTNGGKRNAESSKINLSNIEATIDGKLLKANFVYGNFKNPFIELDLDTRANLSTVFAFVPYHPFEEISGEASISLNFNGDVNKLKNKLTDQNYGFYTSGEITLHGFNFKLKENSLDFKNFNGHFVFNKNDVAATNFIGNIGESDFIINGSFSNIIPYFMFQKQKISLNADFKSTYINLNELLKNQKDDENQSNSDYRFHISPDIDAEFSCTIKKINFRRFGAKRLMGSFQVKNKQMNTDGVSFESLGGIFTLKSTIDNRIDNKITVTNHAALKNIHIDSLFYVFEDFKQDFLKADNIKGVLNTTLATSFVLNSNLEMDSKTLVADIDMTINKGQLKDFAPMQSLSKFIESYELADIKFSELKNNIHIENRTIYIPKMDIKSSVADMSVYGTHTFDNDMDYRVKVPLSVIKRKKDKDESFGAIESEGNKTSVHLKIIGNASNFKVSYDTKGTKESIKEGLKKEKEELKTLFKNPDKLKVKEPDAQVNEEEYFDF